MPRKAREKSESGIYHIILRGCNRQDIFHDEEDFTRFINTLERFKQVSKIRVYGWCLMNNHVHLLLEEGDEALSLTMKRTEVSFVRYYNDKYDTVGHLFQDRFKSEIVDKDEYLMAVVRYIHQNPVKAGLVERPADWKWSSCFGYYTEKGYPSGLLDPDFILGFFAVDKETAVQRFVEFNETSNEDQCLHADNHRRLNDEQAREEIKNVIAEYSPVEFKDLPKKERHELLLRIRGINGISQRQAARILGISSNLMFKA